MPWHSRRWLSTASLRGWDEPPDPSLNHPRLPASVCGLAIVSIKETAFAYWQRFVIIRNLI
jgi:hypothetical protein